MVGSSSSSSSGNSAKCLWADSIVSASADSFP
eukprot:CAMPEP_0115348072 /NCGR_PEP_ID=MMETSP0270-20121206/95221_1 /TAXON_ID=71861 /ORGANISM="Scrippsiella trochoidea, Strain CCMP3099" /LENGTH=31 /DNA_ID= /DNA_START= /DNA_END= /DNA_ORIENTATION=